jgi:hypothetical protein
LASLYHQKIYFLEISKKVHGGFTFMKKTIAAFILAGLIALPVMAQEAGLGLDFSSPRPQFLYFSLGVPMGYDLGNDEVIAGRNFGIGFTVIDNMTVGYDHIFATNVFNLHLLRVGFFFHDMFGAAIGFGTNTGNELAVTVGAVANMFQNRSAMGLTYSLGLRLDYAANANDFGDGAILFTIGATFGL